MEMIQLKIVNKTTFSTILETFLRLEIGRKFRNSSWLSKGFLRSVDKTADLRDLRGWKMTSFQGNVNNVV